MTAVAASTKPDTPLRLLPPDAETNRGPNRSEESCAQEINLTNVSIEPDHRLENAANLQTETEFSSLRLACPPRLSDRSDQRALGDATQLEIHEAAPLAMKLIPHCVRFFD